MIGEDGGFAEQAGAKSHAGRIELREVELDHIVLGDQFGCDEAEGRGENALADAHRDRDADDPHAIHRLFAAGMGRIAWSSRSLRGRGVQRHVRGVRRRW